MVTSFCFALPPFRAQPRGPAPLFPNSKKVPSFRGTGLYGIPNPPSWADVVSRTPISFSLNLFPPFRMGSFQYVTHDSFFYREQFPSSQPDPTISSPPNLPFKVFMDTYRSLSQNVSRIFRAGTPSLPKRHSPQQVGLSDTLLSPPIRTHQSFFLALTYFRVLSIATSVTADSAPSTCRYGTPSRI